MMSFHPPVAFCTKKRQQQKLEVTSLITFCAPFLTLSTIPCNKWRTLEEPNLNKQNDIGDWARKEDGEREGSEDLRHPYLSIDAYHSINSSLDTLQPASLMEDYHHQAFLLCCFLDFLPPLKVSWKIFVQALPNTHLFKIKRKQTTQTGRSVGSCSHLSGHDHLGNTSASMKGSNVRTGVLSLTNILPKHRLHVPADQRRINLRGT